jgi:hypothetical protein
VNFRGFAGYFAAVTRLTAGLPSENLPGISIHRPKKMLSGVKSTVALRMCSNRTGKSFTLFIFFVKSPLTDSM